VGRRGEMRK